MVTISSSVAWGMKAHRFLELARNEYLKVYVFVLFCSLPWAEYYFSKLSQLQVISMLFACH